MNNNNNNNRKRTISSPDIITTKNSGNPATSSSAVVESVVNLTNSKRMKAIAGEIEIESKKKFETLGERSENVENSEIRTPVAVEKAPVKKKTRVVKKIVKKTVIKKVPKHGVVDRSNSNESAVIEIGKPNVVVVDDELKDVVNVNDKEVDSVRNDDSCRNESERSGVVTALLTSDQNWIEVKDVEHRRVEMQENDQNVIELQNSDQIGIELQNVDRNRVEMLDSDQNRIELQNSDHNRVEMQDNDQTGIELQNTDQNRVGLQDNDRNGIELQNVDQNCVELQDSDRNRIELQDLDHNRVKMQDNDQSGIKLQDSDHNRIELQNSDQNRVEMQDMEHDISIMDVEENEGEEGVKELVVNNKTDGLKSQEDLGMSRVVSGELVAPGLRVKHRTKIFIHGLDEKIKEEDIRKVFEEIGEVVEVKLITNFNTGKSRGFGFIRYASADLANMALIKFHNVEICGRPCITAAIEGTDAILLNNIDKKWNNEYVVMLLQKIGIKKIDEVWVVPDSENTELNLGFAFIEFETKKDAQIAFNKLQNKYVFGRDSKIKVAWAEPLADPVKEEMHNRVKSVYAEHIPSSWDENEVKDHFIIFGAIESIALAKNLRSTHRNDFAFINFKTCDAARSCVEALSCKKSTNKNGPEGHLKVSLAKSIPKGKPVNTTLQSTVTKVSKVYKKVNQSIPSQSRYQKASQLRPFQENSSASGVYKPQIPTNMKFLSIGRHEDCKKDVGSSTTDELVRLLREQASWKHGGPSSSAGVSIGHHQVPSGGQQSFTELGSKSLYHDRRAYPQTHFQIPNPAPPRPLASSFPHYDQQRAHYTSGPFDVAKPNPRHFQIRDQSSYPGSSSIYRQRH